MPAASASRRASKQPATRDVGKEASMAAAADALQICRSHQAEGQARCACRQVCHTGQPRPSLVGKFRPSWGIASGPASTSRCPDPRRHQVRAPRGLLCRARRRNPAGSAINQSPATVPCGWKPNQPAGASRVAQPTRTGGHGKGAPANGHDEVPLVVATHGPSAPAAEASGGPSRGAWVPVGRGSGGGVRPFYRVTTCRRRDAAPAFSMDASGRAMEARPGAPAPSPAHRERAGAPLPLTSPPRYRALATAIAGGHASFPPS